MPKTTPKHSAILDAARREAAAAKKLNKLVAEYGTAFQNARPGGSAVRDVNKLLVKETKLLEAALNLYEARVKTRKTS